jgi:prepilin-type processing-associated H-X9-DG protein
MDENARSSWPGPPSPPRRESPIIRAWVTLGALTIVAVILWPIFAIQREHGNRRTCTSDLKQVVLGALLYSQDNDDRFPNAHWMDATLPYIKNDTVFRCVDLEQQDSAAFGRAFELNMVGKQVSKVGQPDMNALVFDSEATHRNAIARLASGIARPGRHHEGNNIGFVDGHVKWLSDSDTAKRWPPILEERHFD